MQPDSNKKKHAISLEKAPQEVMDIFNEKYPHGFNDYLPDLVKYSPGVNPKTGKAIEPFYAVTVETETDIYLLKIKVQTDAADDIRRWLESEEEAEVEQVAGTNPEGESGDDTLPDDNISQYGGEDEPAES